MSGPIYFFNIDRTTESKLLRYGFETNVVLVAARTAWNSRQANQDVRFTAYSAGYRYLASFSIGAMNDDPSYDALITMYKLQDRSNNWAEVPL